MTSTPIDYPSEVERDNRILMEKAEAKATRFFRDRGISPTLSEYREVVAAYRTGLNPMRIH